MFPLHKEAEAELNSVVAAGRRPSLVHVADGAVQRIRSAASYLDCVLYVVRTDRDNRLKIYVYCTIHGKEDRSICQTPRKSFSFSGCNIIFTEIDAHAFQVGICESGRSLPCRRLFTLPLAHWRLFYWSFRRRLL